MPLKKKSAKSEMTFNVDEVAKFMALYKAMKEQDDEEEDMEEEDKSEEMDSEENGKKGGVMIVLAPGNMKKPKMLKKSK
jgi:hypothetical protein